MLLEKGWAKLHGTYYRTETGLPSLAASHMLGVPTMKIDHKSLQSKGMQPDEAFAKLRKFDSKGYVMMAAS